MITESERELEKDEIEDSFKPMKESEQQEEEKK